MRAIMETKSLREVYNIVTKNLEELDAIFSKRRSDEGQVPVKQILDYINENYGKRDLGIETIASQFGFSATYIGRMFQKEYGENVTNVITNMRLKQAVQLLEETDEPVALIAEKVGFGSSSYLGVQFKKKYGVSPSEFRKRMKIK